MSIVAPLTDAERVRFIACARSVVGAKFRHRGRGPNFFDCVGHVKFALAAVGRFVLDRKHYGRHPEKDGLPVVCEEHFGPPVQSMQAADVVSMSWRQDADGPLTNHVGIIFDYPLGGFAIVHALASAGRVVEHRLSDEWIARIDAIYRTGER